MSSPSERHHYVRETTWNRSPALVTVLGATLAGLDESNQQYFEQLGQGLSTARQIDCILDGIQSEALIVLPELDESQLQAHTERRRDDANQAFDVLSETFDVASLRNDL